MIDTNMQIYRWSVYHTIMIVMNIDAHRWNGTHTHSA